MSRVPSAPHYLPGIVVEIVHPYYPDSLAMAVRATEQWTCLAHSKLLTNIML
jgi:hypothetical protein